MIPYQSFQSNRIEAFDLAQSLKRVEPFTQVPQESLVDLADLVSVVLTADVPGDFVECGVWRGGASFLMADLLRQTGVTDRKVWLFDSFEGMPPPEEIDGPKALAYTRNTEDPLYRDNNRVSLEEVQTAAEGLELASYTRFVKGWFDQTLPAHRDHVGPIAILRIDCDWYSSVQCCLDNLYDQVSPGGFIILDDYYVFDGCAVAVHEFLAKRGLTHRIESVAGEWGGCLYYYCARLRKGEPNWPWAHRAHLAAQEIARLVPSGDPLILVDDDQLGNEIAAGRPCTSFPESDALPAVGELEALRRSGARFIAFAWPAFWWLDCYADLHRHLRSQYRCLLENDRLVLFDLRR